MRRARAGRSGRIPKESRTTQMIGNSVRGTDTANGVGEDYGIWYRCWNCGWACNEDRDELGGRESRDGVVLEDYVRTPERWYAIDNPISSTACLGGPINHFHVAQANGSAGQPKGVRHAIRVSESSSGCPFCHTKNWRGDY